MDDISYIFDKYAKLTEIESFKFKYKDFKLVYFDSPSRAINGKVYNSDKKLWYLMGDTLTKESNILRYDNFEILLSLLKLANLINSTWDKYGNLEKSSQLKYSDEVIEWCKQYGLPDYSEYFMKNYSIGKTIPPGGFRAFPLYNFKRQLLILLDAFNLWYGLTYEDIKLISKHDHHIKPKNDTYTEKDLQFLKESVSYIPLASLKLFYNADKDNYEIVPYASNIFDVAYFQLAMLMTNKNDEKIKYCSKCGVPFIYHDGNTKYCDNCKRDMNKEYVKNFRKREKSKIINLYKEGVPIEKLAKDFKKTETQIKKWIREVDLDG